MAQPETDEQRAGLEGKLAPVPPFLQAIGAIPVESIRGVDGRHDSRLFFVRSRPDLAGIRRFLNSRRREYGIYAFVVNGKPTLLVQAGEEGEMTGIDDVLARAIRKDGAEISRMVAIHNHDRGLAYPSWLDFTYDIRRNYKAKTQVQDFVYSRTGRLLEFGNHRSTKDRGAPLVRIRTWGNEEKTPDVQWIPWRVARTVPGLYALEKYLTVSIRKKSILRLDMDDEKGHWIRWDREVTLESVLKDVGVLAPAAGLEEDEWDELEDIPFEPQWLTPSSALEAERIQDAMEADARTEHQPLAFPKWSRWKLERIPGNRVGVFARDPATGKLLGFIIYEWRLDIEEEDLRSVEFHILNLAVLPEGREKGADRWLINRVSETAQHRFGAYRGVPVAVLADLHPDAEEIRDLFERLEFRPSGWMDSSPVQDNATAFRMHLHFVIAAGLEEGVRAIIAQAETRLYDLLVKKGLSVRREEAVALLRVQNLSAVDVQKRIGRRLQRGKSSLAEQVVERVGAIRQETIPQIIRYLKYHLFDLGTVLEPVYARITPQAAAQYPGMPYVSMKELPAAVDRLFDALDLQPGQRLLEVGPGSEGGIALIALLRGLRVVVVEPEKPFEIDLPKLISELQGTQNPYLIQLQDMVDAGQLVRTISSLKLFQEKVAQLRGWFSEENLTVIRGDFSDPEIQAQVLTAGSFDHAIATDVMNPSGQYTHSSNAMTTSESRRIEGILQGLARVSQRAQNLYVSFVISEEGRYREVVGTTIASLEAALRSQGLSPANYARVPHPSSGGVLSGRLYQFSPGVPVTSDTDAVKGQRVLLFTRRDDYGMALVKELESSPHQIVGVVTIPGAGNLIQWAGTRQVPIWDASRYFDTMFVKKAMRNDPSFQIKMETLARELQGVQPDVSITAHFPRLPPLVVGVSAKALNVHPSGLPKYAGGFTLPALILNGERETTVTIHELTDTTDAGDIVKQQGGILIQEQDDASTLQARVVPIAAHLLHEALDDIGQGIYSATPQGSPEGPHAWGVKTRRVPDGTRIILRNEGLLTQIAVDWSQLNTEEILRRVRAFRQDQSGLYAYTNNDNGQILFLVRAQGIDGSFTGKAGQVLQVDQDGGVVVKTADGAVKVWFENTGDVSLKVGSLLNITTPVSKVTGIPQSDPERIESSAAGGSTSLTTGLEELAEDHPLKGILTAEEEGFLPAIREKRDFPLSTEDLLRLRDHLIDLVRGILPPGGANRSNPGKPGNHPLALFLSKDIANPLHGDDLWRRDFQRSQIEKHRGGVFEAIRLIDLLHQRSQRYRTGRPSPEDLPHFARLLVRTAVRAHPSYEPKRTFAILYPDLNKEELIRFGTLYANAERKITGANRQRIAEVMERALKGTYEDDRKWVYERQRLTLKEFPRQSASTPKWGLSDPSSQERLGLYERAFEDIEQALAVLPRLVEFDAPSSPPPLKAPPPTFFKGVRRTEPVSGRSVVDHGRTAKPPTSQDRDLLLKAWSSASQELVRTLIRLVGVQVSFDEAGVSLNDYSSSGVKTLGQLQAWLSDASLGKWNGLEVLETPGGGIEFRLISREGMRFAKDRLIRMTQGIRGLRRFSKDELLRRILKTNQTAGSQASTARFPAVGLATERWRAGLEEGPLLIQPGLDGYAGTFGRDSTPWETKGVSELARRIAGAKDGAVIRVITHDPAEAKQWDTWGLKPLEGAAEFWKSRVPHKGDQEVSIETVEGREFLVIHLVQPIEVTPRMTVSEIRLTAAEPQFIHNPALPKGFGAALGQVQRKEVKSWGGSGFSVETIGSLLQQGRLFLVSMPLGLSSTRDRNEFEQMVSSQTGTNFLANRLMSEEELRKVIEGNRAASDQRDRAAVLSWAKPEVAQIQGDLIRLFNQKVESMVEPNPADREELEDDLNRLSAERWVEASGVAKKGVKAVQQFFHDQKAALHDRIARLPEQAGPLAEHLSQVHQMLADRAWDEFIPLQKNLERMQSSPDGNLPREADRKSRVLKRLAEMIRNVEAVLREGGPEALEQREKMRYWQTEALVFLVVTRSLTEAEAREFLAYVRPLEGLLWSKLIDPWMKGPVSETHARSETPWLVAMFVLPSLVEPDRFGMGGRENVEPIEQRTCMMLREDIQAMAGASPKDMEAFVLSHLRKKMREVRRGWGYLPEQLRVDLLLHRDAAAWNMTGVSHRLASEAARDQGWVRTAEGLVRQSENAYTKSEQMAERPAWRPEIAPSPARSPEADEKELIDFLGRLEKVIWDRNQPDAIDFSEAPPFEEPPLFGWMRRHDPDLHPETVVLLDRFAGLISERFQADPPQSETVRRCFRLVQVSLVRYLMSTAQMSFSTAQRFLEDPGALQGEVWEWQLARQQEEETNRYHRIIGAYFLLMLTTPAEQFDPKTDFQKKFADRVRAFYSGRMSAAVDKNPPASEQREQFSDRFEEQLRRVGEVPVGQKIGVLTGRYAVITNLSWILGEAVTQAENSPEQMGNKQERLQDYTRQLKQDFPDYRPWFPPELFSAGLEENTEIQELADLVLKIVPAGTQPEVGQPGKHRLGQFLLSKEGRNLRTFIGWSRALQEKGKRRVAAPEEEQTPPQKVDTQSTKEILTRLEERAARAFSEQGPRSAEDLPLFSRQLIHLSGTSLNASVSYPGVHETELVDFARLYLDRGNRQISPEIRRLLYGRMKQKISRTGRWPWVQEMALGYFQDRFPDRAAQALREDSSELPDLVVDQAFADIEAAIRNLSDYQKILKTPQPPVQLPASLGVGRGWVGAAPPQREPPVSSRRGFRAGQKSRTEIANEWVEVSGALIQAMIQAAPEGERSLVGQGTRIQLNIGRQGIAKQIPVWRLKKWVENSIGNWRGFLVGEVDQVHGTIQMVQTSAYPTGSRPGDPTDVHRLPETSRQLKSLAADSKFLARLWEPLESTGLEEDEEDTPGVPLFQGGHFTASEWIPFLSGYLAQAVREKKIPLRVRLSGPEGQAEVWFSPSGVRVDDLEEDRPADWNQDAASAFLRVGVDPENGQQRWTATLNEMGGTLSFRFAPHEVGGSSSKDLTISVSDDLGVGGPDEAENQAPEEWGLFPWENGQEPDWLAGQGGASWGVAELLYKGSLRDLAAWLERQSISDWKESKGISRIEIVFPDNPLKISRKIHNLDGPNDMDIRWIAGRILKEVGPIAGLDAPYKAVWVKDRVEIRPAPPSSESVAGLEENTEIQEWVDLVLKIVPAGIQPEVGQPGKHRLGQFLLLEEGRNLRTFIGWARALQGKGKRRVAAPEEEQAPPQKVDTQRTKEILARLESRAERAFSEQGPRSAEDLPLFSRHLIHLSGIFSNVSVFYPGVQEKELADFARLYLDRKSGRISPEIRRLLYDRMKQRISRTGRWSWVQEMALGYFQDRFPDRAAQALREDSSELPNLVVDQAFDDIEAAIRNLSDYQKILKTPQPPVRLRTSLGAEKWVGAAPSPPKPFVPSRRGLSAAAGGKSRVTIASEWTEASGALIRAMIQAAPKGEISLVGQGTRIQLNIGRRWIGKQIPVQRLKEWVENSIGNWRGFLVEEVDQVHGTIQMVQTSAYPTGSRPGDPMDVHRLPETSRQLRSLAADSEFLARLWKPLESADRRSGLEEQLTPAGLEEGRGYVAVGGVAAFIPDHLPADHYFAVAVGAAQAAQMVQAGRVPTRLIAVAAELEDIAALTVLGVPGDQILRGWEWVGGWEAARDYAIRLARDWLTGLQGLRVSVLQVTARSPQGVLAQLLEMLPSAWQTARPITAGDAQRTLDLEA